MSEDQGATKGQDKSDATVKPDAAIPAKPAALSDKDLEKVAGGLSFSTVNDLTVTNRSFFTPATPTKFGK